MPTPFADLFPLEPQHIDGINLFGLISIVSLLYCAPAAVFAEGHVWGAAWDAATTKMGQGALLQLLAVGGIFYHLYNQVGRAGARQQKLRHGLRRLESIQWLQCFISPHV